MSEMHVMGVKVEGESGLAEGIDPFADLAHVDTPLGEVGFTRYSDGWSWYLVTWRQRIDDFDTVESRRHRTLLGAVSDCDRALRAVFARAKEALRHGND